MNKKIMSKNKWMKAAGVMMALMLAVLAVPGTAEAATKSGTLDGVTYTVGATCDYNKGSGYGRYVDVRKSLGLTVTFFYNDYKGTERSLSASTGGTTYVSTITPEANNVSSGYKRTVSVLTIAGNRYTVTASKK